MYTWEPRNLDNSLLELQLFVSVNIPLNLRIIMGIARRTLHGLFSSNPSGAEGLSVCPRRYPVNLLSRSITVFGSALTNLTAFVGITLL
jgi:hypothetical protein